MAQGKSKIVISFQKASGSGIAMRYKDRKPLRQSATTDPIREREREHERDVLTPVGVSVSDGVTTIHSSVAIVGDVSLALIPYEQTVRASRGEFSNFDFGSDLDMPFPIEDEQDRSWNIRGLNGFSKQRAVRNWISDSSLGLIGLLETKVEQSHLQSVVSVVCPSWQFLLNATDSIACRVLEVTCRVTHVSKGSSFRITFVYGSNDLGNHRNLWDCLRDQPTEFDSEGLPWLVLGDFNAILGASNRMGGDLAWYGYMDDFGYCIHDVELIGVPFTRLRYTCHNSQHGDGIILRKAVWDEPIVGNPMFRLSRKLGLLKQKLKSLHIRVSSHSSSRVIEARAQWEIAQENLDRDPLSTECIFEERNLANQYFSLCRDNEAFFKQRSRVQWLNLGDQNTKFFHKSLIHRQDLLVAPIQPHIVEASRYFSGRISADMISALIAPITDDEIRIAVFSIPNDKALGPDGY
ncbi:uncharacterized protein LOC116105416 [Pistacia vera]|uniref:uncharacterized protein LOC116105416 n=1 Tax=Pistacia vera TaxID=55513 RepID=UPI001262F10B|nr:uncharacterized protein LOC116105416 [Pistacia vera]